MRPTFVTIDWDYFIPEKMEWDFGHREAKLFLDFLWQTRFKVFREMRTNGLEQEFWAKFKKQVLLPSRDVEVSDSHVAVWESPALHGSLDLILVDRHHDLYTEPNEHVDCGNWAAAWLSENKQRHLYWVAPPDVIALDFPRKYARQVTILKELPKVVMGVGLHICRSGCWTPPWLDGQFRQFVDGSGKLPTTLQPEWCDPLAFRWKLGTYFNLAKRTRIDQEAMAAMSAGSFRI